MSTGTACNLRDNTAVIPTYPQLVMSCIVIASESEFHFPLQIVPYPNIQSRLFYGLPARTTRCGKGIHAEISCIYAPLSGPWLMAPARRGFGSAIHSLLYDASAASLYVRYALILTRPGFPFYCYLSPTTTGSTAAGYTPPIHCSDMLCEMKGKGNCFLL